MKHVLLPLSEDIIDSSVPHLRTKPIDIPYPTPLAKSLRSLIKGSNQVATYSSA